MSSQKKSRKTEIVLVTSGSYTIGSSLRCISELIQSQLPNVTSSMVM